MRYFTSSHLLPHETSPLIPRESPQNLCILDHLVSVYLRRILIGLPAVDAYIPFIGKIPFPACQFSPMTRRRACAGDTGDKWVTSKIVSFVTLIYLLFIILAALVTR